MIDTTFLDLILNGALLLALVLVFDYAAARVFHIKQPLFIQMLSGVMIGIIGLTIMLTPWVMIPGLVFDTRSVLLGISGLYFGLIPTAIAMLMTAAYRLYLGGSGALTGILVIIATGASGVLWRHFRKLSLENISGWELYLFGLTIHLMMLALMFTLPLELALRTLSNITIPVLLFYPIGTALLGMLMTQRMRQEKMQLNMRQSEVILNESLNNLNRSQKIAHIGNWCLDLKSNTFTASPEGLRLFGYTAQATPTFEEIAALILPEDRPRAHEALMNAIKTRDPYQIEMRIVTKDTGEIRYLLSLAEVESDANGIPLRVFGINQDISERKINDQELQNAQTQLRQLLRNSEHSRRALLSLIEDQKEAEQKIRRLNLELEQRVTERTASLVTANKELESFSYSVSHDLRTPLRALDGFSTALLEEYHEALDEKAKHYLTRIKEAAQHMGQLIDDLLNLSRVTRSEFTRQRVDLSALVAKIAAELIERFPLRAVELDIAPDIVVEGDSNLLNICLENLLNNAIKFTSLREQSIIQFGSLEQENEYIYFIRDNGAGFNMEYADKLFSPFQRLHGINEFPGTGIGLSIVQRIISRHSGHIWCESEVDKGTTFYFTLK